MNKPHIFLDSTVLFTYPFKRNNFNISLFELSESSELEIYISDIVYKEMLNNYKEELKQKIKQFESSHTALLRLIKKQKNKIPIPMHINPPSLESLDDYCRYFVTDLNALLKEKIIIKINFDKKQFDEVIERSILKTKPFSQNKQEFRDCINWLTYKNYISKNKLINCYFITNNITDFYNDSKDDLHPYLKKESPQLKVYKTTKDLFISDEYFKTLDDKIESIKKSKLEKWCKDYLSSPSYAIDIQDFLGFDIESVLSSFLDNVHPREIKIKSDNSFLLFEDVMNYTIGDPSFEVIQDFCYISCPIEILIMARLAFPEGSGILVKDNVELLLKCIVDYSIKPDENAQFEGLRNLKIIKYKK